MSVSWSIPEEDQSKSKRPAEPARPPRQATQKTTSGQSTPSSPIQLCNPPPIPNPNPLNTKNAAPSPNRVAPPTLRSRSRSWHPSRLVDVGAQHAAPPRRHDVIPPPIAPACPEPRRASSRLFLQPRQNCDPTTRDFIDLGTVYS